MANESNKCPNCPDGYLGEDENVCLSCGFTLGSVLTCPNKSLDSKCRKSGEPCHILDLGWETCSLFRET